MTAAAVVEVDGLTHRYGDRVALRDVRFDVRAGEIFGLLGPNGGGKTTLFRILATLLRPTSGTARLFGLDVVASPARARERIAVVFQSPSVDRKLTVRENLMHQGHLYGLRGADLRARIAAMLERMGLADRARDRVESLSGGLRRRVEIAKALLHEPGCLLLDEPSAGLDPGARLDLRRQLEELRARERMTILLTTHHLEEAAACDRLAILSKGERVALGAPEALKAELGGDVVTIVAREPETLRDAIASRFGAAPRVVDGALRLERDRGHELVASLADAFPGRIDSITVGKPTLEDVFIRKTGHRFWEDGA